MVTVMIIEESEVCLECLEGCVGEERGVGRIGEDILRGGEWLYMTRRSGLIIRPWSDPWVSKPTLAKIKYFGFAIIPMGSLTGQLRRIPLGHLTLRHACGKTFWNLRTVSDLGGGKTIRHRRRVGSLGIILRQSDISEIIFVRKTLYSRWR